jgi:regulation of enolase protein 1 (concanavalin A-like superfamily)
VNVGLPGGVFSDDFNTESLLPGWSLEGPTGGVSLVSAGTEAYAELVVDAGSNNGAWNTNRSTRLMQAASNEDFGLEAKFLSTPNQAYHIQGLLVEQDGQNWIRFDTVFDGTKLRVFAATTTNGISSARIDVVVPTGGAGFLRVERSGDQWTLKYSSDGTNWTTAGSFAHQLNVTAAGVFAGNEGQATGYTAEVDYVFNTAAPVIPEDAIPIPPVATDDVLTTSGGVPLVIDIASDLLGNDSDLNNDPLFLSGFGAPAQGTLEDNGDGTLTYTPSLGFAGVDTFTYTVSDGGFDDTAAVRIGVDNTAPVAGDDSGVTDEDTALVIDALANDGDPDGDVFGVVATSDPANGSVTINPDGTLTYVPDANFNGADSFTYTLGDGVASTVATVDVAVTSIPDAPIALDDSLSTAPDTPLTIDFAGDLLANDSDGDGDPLFLDSLGVPSNGTLVDNGDGTFLYMPNSGFVGTDSFTYTINDGTGRTATAAATIVVADFIDVWYGTEQTFGQIGEAQEWINILGNVDTSEVVSLAYSLNGGPDRALTIGPNTRRLQNDGDFNVEISYSELDGSATDDVVTIKATLSSGNVDTEDVIIHYESGHQWTPNYSIDWGTVTNLQDVVQVADGLWEVSNGGARPVELGYDRLLTFGDQSWDNYELRLSVTTHDLLNVDPSGRDGGAFIIGMLWTGHTDTPVAGTQPKSGWEPGAAFSYSDPDGDGVGKLAVHPSVNSLSTLNSVPFALETGFTYNLLVQVEQVGLFDRMYSLKLWEDSDPEPAGWSLQSTQTFSITDMPATGSVYLNAHYYDVTYNDLTVTEIPGRDIVHGSDGNDILAAVDAAAPSPGRGEIDVFVGHEGSDVFVFGDEFAPYYDDGIAGSSGQLDYGFIWDFVSGADMVQLHGSENDYLLTVDQGGLPSGTAIWLAGQNGEANELIAVLNNATGLDLASQDFVYTDLFV